MRMRVFVLLIVGTCLLQASKNVSAQPYPPGPTSDTTQSLGSFSIVLSPSVSAAFVGTPGYSASTNIFTSPVLDEVNSTTQINRSAGLPLGNGLPVSAPVGSATGGTVSSNPGDTALTFSGNTGLNSGLTYPVPTGSGATAPNTNAVFTQIYSFDLVGGGMSVTAGTSANDPNLPASVGQVTSNSATGGFPARSFFDVFVDINTPLPAGLGGARRH
jgi:hypothetical protein